MMNREGYGLLIGAVTLLFVLAPEPVTFLGILFLSLLLYYEVGRPLGEEEIILALIASSLSCLSKPLGLTLILFLSLLKAYRSWSLQELFKISFLLIYTCYLPSYLFSLKLLGTHETLSVLLSIWALDTFSFYVGKNFGRRPFFERLSPNKTYEGFLGGLGAGTLVFTLVSPLPFFKALSFGLLTSLAGVFGDLFESFIKRQLKIKDFSRVLGEHGGITDRFDSLIMVAPLGYFLLG